MTASLELSKELYELSGWETDKLWVDHEQLGVEVMGLEVENHLGHGIARICPAYDLGYLLRKLPYKVKDAYQYDQFGANLKATASGGWYMCYGEPGKDSEMYFNSADTPENAAAKLAIELFKSGVLKREEL